ncbi:ATPase WRNIP1 isoform X2 [Ochotona curzoniae]|uniref:ATPase WRNIP1 isoform X2 n=1 Tax=Ochotona curzoniae TaxID=130825 RepID=UPI001B350205|nr:ATPase WRNIP1 isoform X2 [Ochotona curzoniae]XP_040853300.1 ATPase WRNIP1 isoform X2 [Ochotona curzoniae]
MEVSGPEDDPFLSQLHQVQCPVCQHMMPAAHINSHLDRCLLLHPAGHAEPAAGPQRAKRRRLSESSALKQPATPTAAESSEGEAEDADDGGETESRESYDAPPTPSGARLIPDFPVARSGSPGRKGSAKRPAAAAGAAGSASPRSWDEAEAPEEEEEAVGDGDGDADVDGEEDAGQWDADAASAAAAAVAFGAGGAGRPHSRAPAAEEIRQMLEGKPLADKMRPDTLQDYFGQCRAVGQETLLRSLLEANEIPSLILWGPPGCGKTTLAHIIANSSKKHSIRFVTLSATNAKTNDVRDVIKQAQNEKSFFKRKTILFIDEIHRFNKSQQNPSFQVNAALLSRCRVVVLEKLPVEAMVTILMRAINSLGIHVLDSSRPTDSLSHSSNSNTEPSVLIEDKAVDTLAYLSDGDARAGLNGLQLAVLARLSSRKMFCKKSGQTYSPSRVLVTENDVKEGLQRSHILYDRAGEEHYNCISALHKAMRGSDQNASLYWLARMLEGGEDPLYVARRLVRFASEDIGLADPSALTQAVAAYQGCHFIGMPECEVLLAQCVVYFARAPKSIEVYSAYNNVKACLRNHQGPLPPVPLHLRNAPTRLMKDLGYGKGYKYNPMYSEPVDQEYLPEELRGVDFFKQRRC